jgi:hypothetical protein
MIVGHIVEGAVLRIRPDAKIVVTKGTAMTEELKWIFRK